MSYCSPCGKDCDELGHGRLHLGGGGQRVGAGPLEDAQRNGHPLVEIAVAVIVGGAELDAARCRGCAPRARRTPDLTMILPKASVSVSRPCVSTLSWKAPGLRHRRLVDDAGRDLHVLAAERRDHVAGGQIAERELLGIEPDAHRVVARAEDGDVADAVDAREHVLHVQRGVVGDVEQVARAVGRAQMDHHHQVGRLLGDGDADGAHLLGQTRQGDGDAVLHQHLRRIEVGAELEGDGQRHAAVAGRLRRHVEHVVDAVDLLLDRGGDGLGHDLGGGAGIVAR